MVFCSWVLTAYTDIPIGQGDIMAINALGQRTVTRFNDAKLLHVIVKHTVVGQGEGQPARLTGKGVVIVVPGGCLCPQWGHPNPESSPARWQNALADSPGGTVSDGPHPYDHST